MCLGSQSQEWLSQAWTTSVPSEGYCACAVCRASSPRQLHIDLTLVELSSGGVVGGIQHLVPPCCTPGSYIWLSGATIRRLITRLSVPEGDWETDWRTDDVNVMKIIAIIYYAREKNITRYYVIQRQLGQFLWLVHVCHSTGGWG